MKAITLRPPWGWAVLNGKSPENRTRNIAGSYRGPLVIHQGKRRYWPMAMRMAQGHLLNAPKRAA